MVTLIVIAFKLIVAIFIAFVVFTVCFYVVCVPFMFVWHLFFPPKKDLFTEHFEQHAAEMEQMAQRHQKMREYVASRMAAPFPEKSPFSSNQPHDAAFYEEEYRRSLSE